MSATAIISLLGPIIGKVAGKFLKNKGDEAKFLSELNLKLAEQETTLIQALVKSDVAQAEINKTEAESDNPVKSLWRPAIAWICVFGLAWSVLLPVVSWGLQLAGVTVPELPQLGSAELTTLTFGMLGLGGLRTYEKKTGVSK